MNYTVPTCAACRSPIGAAAKFLLIGTEVLHSACVRAGGQETVLWEARRLAAKHAVDLAESQRRILNLTVERDAFAQQERAAHAKLFALYDRNAEAEISQLRAALVAAHAASAQLAATLIATQAEVVRLAASRPPAAQVANTPDDRVDDTVQRFALLELE